MKVDSDKKRPPRPKRAPSLAGKVTPEQLAAVFTANRRGLARSTLKVQGLGPQPILVNGNGCMFAGQQLASFDRFRRFDGLEVEQVSAVVELFERFSQHADRVTIEGYHLKHCVERHLGQYVSTGACVVAAIVTGFDQVVCATSGKTRVQVPVALAELLRCKPVLHARRSTAELEPVVICFEEIER